MGNQVNPTTKKEERVKRKSENSKKFGHRSKGKGWPKEKELLDKGDGLATAAGARRNDEVTSHISTYIHIHEGSLVRLPVVFRRSEEPREALLGEAGELSVGAP